MKQVRWPLRRNSVETPPNTSVVRVKITITSELSLFSKLGGVTVPEFRRGTTVGGDLETCQGTEGYQSGPRSVAESTAFSLTQRSVHTNTCQATKPSSQTPSSEMGRAPCCDKANVKKGPWSPEEDAKLKSYIEQHGTGGNWIALPQKIGRTDNDIKNYWNTRLKKKLLGKQRKAHQPRKGNSSLKQGNTRKGSDDQNPVVNYDSSNQLASYWPELPVLAPIPYSNQEPRFNDHTSIRKLLLIKLGGKFSCDENNQIQDGTNLQFSTNLSSNQQPYVPSIDQMVSSASADALNTCTSQMTNAQYSMNEQGMVVLPGQSSFPVGFEEALYENPQRLDDLEFLYGDIVSNTTESTSGESFGWGENMSTLSYPPIIPNYEDLQQGMI
ncbi:myb domain protein 84 [Actinidia rufa]|uniref:Myb domain protein 84 n=1 Tax=Actinidia rufa TaxID=165716 RepID=A0A7J0EK35_9ERIC|nr:myb domain protein 84 [Actinidia rufa]